MVKWTCIITLACFLVVLGAKEMASALPGGEQLAFVAWEDGNRHIYLLDVGRGAVTNVTGTTSNEYEPAWSPDGAQIAFVSDRDGNREIYVQRVSCEGLFLPCKRDVRRITHNSIADHAPAWSPDSTQLIYVAEWFESAELVVASLDGRSVRFLTNNQAMDSDPAWSPDGRTIVFSSDRENRWNADLYLMDANGTNSRMLFSADGSQVRPIWSPDGRQLLFSASSPNGYQLALLDLDHPETPTYLGIQMAYSDTASWSTNGDGVALVMEVEDGQPDIYIFHLSCLKQMETCLRRQTHDTRLEGTPRWRPGTNTR